MRPQRRRHVQLMGTIVSVVAGVEPSAVAESADALLGPVVPVGVLPRARIIRIVSADGAKDAEGVACVVGYDRSGRGRDDAALLVERE